MKSKTIPPAPQALAILRTCRLIHEETKFLWLPHVLFHFETPEYLLDNLSPLHLATLSQIQNLRTGGDPLMLQPIDDGDEEYFRLLYRPRLLRGLSLNTLTVLGPSDGAIAYDILDGLVKYGKGWRELHFITPNSTMLGFKKIDLSIAPSYWRKPQPASWSKILSCRDSADFSSSVTIYRATLPGQGFVIDHRTRQVFKQKAVENFGVEEDIELCAEEEREKELLVVAKRGLDTNIAGPDGPPYSEICQWSYDMTWPEVRRRCFDHIVATSEETEGDYYNDVS